MKDRKNTNDSLSNDRFAPITTQDIVFAAKMGTGNINSNTNPAGEFGDPREYGGQLPLANEPDEQLRDRLIKCIDDFAQRGVLHHLTVTKSMKAGKENHVTRVLTNEFFFYTQKPLTLSQFELLQQKIIDMAKTYPENFHLILSSFAVKAEMINLDKTVDNKVMSVVAHVECGLKPRLSLIVKNNISSIDPIYNEMQDNVITPLYNVHKPNGDDVSSYKIKIDNQDHYFTFNNVVECKTLSGASFYSCIDICFDHTYGAAQLYLRRTVDAALIKALSDDRYRLPTYCSHILVSNSLRIEKQFCLGEVTQADPEQSLILYQHAPRSEVANAFGTPAIMYKTPERSCDLLPTEQATKIEYYRQRFFSQPLLTEEDIYYLKKSTFKVGERKLYARALQKVYLADEDLAMKLLSQIPYEKDFVSSEIARLFGDQKNLWGLEKFNKWGGYLFYALPAVKTNRNELDKRLDDFNQLEKSPEVMDKLKILYAKTRLTAYIETKFEVKRIFQSLMNQLDSLPHDNVDIFLQKSADIIQTMDNEINRLDELAKENADDGMAEYFRDNIIGLKAEFEIIIDKLRGPVVKLETPFNTAEITKTLTSNAAGVATTSTDMQQSTAPSEKNEPTIQDVEKLLLEKGISKKDAEAYCNIAMKMGNNISEMMYGLEKASVVQVREHVKYKIHQNSAEPPSMPKLF